MSPSLDQNRYQCSELVKVLYEDRFGRTREAIANLEEISSKSATLLFDDPLDRGLPISFSVKGHDMYGLIESSAADPTLGWFVRIRLNQFSRWCGRMFVPEHFLALCASARMEPEMIGPSKVFTRG